MSEGVVVRRPSLARVLAGVLLALAVRVSLGAAARPAAADPIFVNWAALLPSLTDAYDPNSANDCVAGRPDCVDITIAEMQRRFEALGSSCDHNAVFSLAYLRTTQTYEWARDQTRYFHDTPWVNHACAAFSTHYFSPHSNSPSPTPPA